MEQTQKIELKEFEEMGTNVTQTCCWRVAGAEAIQNGGRRHFRRPHHAPAERWQPAHFHLLQPFSRWKKPSPSCHTVELH